MNFWNFSVAFWNDSGYPKGQSDTPKFEARQVIKFSKIIYLPLWLVNICCNFLISKTAHGCTWSNSLDRGGSRRSCASRWSRTKSLAIDWSLRVHIGTYPLLESLRLYLKTFKVHNRTSIAVPILMLFWPTGGWLLPTSTICALACSYLTMLKGILSSKDPWYHMIPMVSCKMLFEPN